MGSGRNHSAILSATLRAEYIRLFDACTIRPSRFGEVRAAVSRLLDYRPRYGAVASATGVPWFVIGAIHSLESDFDFTRHLHNGDPLTGRTVHVPRGRPATGSPPFAWEASARDALTLKGLDAWHEWSAPGALYQIERYNGWGYRLCHPEVLSPYLWAGSRHYTRGKYFGDHRWSPTAVSGQVGAAVLLKALYEGGQIRFAPSRRKLSLVPIPPSRRAQASGTEKTKT